MRLQNLEMFISIYFASCTSRTFKSLFLHNGNTSIILILHVWRGKENVCTPSSAGYAGAGLCRICPVWPLSIVASQGTGQNAMADCYCRITSHFLFGYGKVMEPWQLLSLKFSILEISWLHVLREHRYRFGRTISMAKIYFRKIYGFTSYGNLFLILVLVSLTWCRTLIQTGWYWKLQHLLCFRKVFGLNPDRTFYSLSI
jgi:hypothetical protein